MLHPLGEIEQKQWCQISPITIFINIAEILHKYCMKSLTNLSKGSISGTSRCAFKNYNGNARGSYYFDTGRLISQLLNIPFCVAFSKITACRNYINYIEPNEHLGFHFYERRE